MLVSWILLYPAHVYFQLYMAQNQYEDVVSPHPYADIYRIPGTVGFSFESLLQNQAMPVWQSALPGLNIRYHPCSQSGRLLRGKLFPASQFGCAHNNLQFFGLSFSVLRCTVQLPYQTIRGKRPSHSLTAIPRFGLSGQHLRFLQ